MLAPRQHTYLIRSTLTVGVGGISFLLTNVLVSDVFQQLALSIFVGGFCLLVQLLVDIEHRLADVKAQKDEMRDAVIESFREIDEAAALVAHTMKAGFEPEGLIELVRRIADLDPEAPPLVTTFLRREVRRLAALVAAIGAGSVEYDGEDRDGLLGFTIGKKGNWPPAARILPFSSSIDD